MSWSHKTSWMKKPCFFYFFSSVSVMVNLPHTQSVPSERRSTEQSPVVAVALRVYSSNKELLLMFKYKGSSPLKDFQLVEEWGGRAGLA